MAAAHNPRAEAFARLEGRYEVRVLEPSPPAVDSPPWFADDPTARGQVPAGRKLVSPVSTGDLAWEQLARGDEQLAEWCRERWLGPYRQLGEAPPELEQTRASLQRLAGDVLAPARQAANGKIGLRYTRGGFGTPFFGNDMQLRVQAEPPRLITQSPTGVDDDALALPPAATAFLADWFGFAFSVLEQLRAEAAAGVPGLDPSRVQLWPEHFDVSVDLGSAADGARAGYGCSPGDELHPEPYVYVAPWGAAPSGELWQATGFAGAELPYAELVRAADQREAALAFLRRRLAALTR
jgi:hypothetical protein